MIFKRDSYYEKAGEIAGFLFSYALFTFLLYVILAWTERLPGDWTILQVAGITLLIALAGYWLKRVLL